MMAAVQRLLAALPEWIVEPLCRVGGWLWLVAFRYRRRTIFENLARAFPSLEPKAQRRLAAAACSHLLRTFLETMRIPRYERTGMESLVRCEGTEYVAQARAKGKGVLCLSGHLGSFELAVAAGVKRTGPVSLVVKSFSPGFDRVMTSLREGAGLGVLRAEAGLRPILKALKNGEVVVFVLDQNATRDLGVFVDFFGEPACTMTGLALLALRTGAPVVAAIPHREPGGRHVLRITPEIPLEQKATRAETVQHMTQRYTRIIEDAIRAHPEQWFWSHKRWRTRPRIEDAAPQAASPGAEP